MSWHGVPIPFDGRDDWLEQRRQGIGASDVAAILGMSPYGSPITVWHEKVNGSEKTETEAMHFGKVLEDVVVGEFEDRTGLHVGLRETLIRHPKFVWVMATIDGLAFESPVIDDDDEFDPLANVQLKTSGDWSRWKEIPDHYQIQVQWEMLASGLDQTYMPVLHGGRRFELYEVEADVGVQQRLLDKIGEWYGTHINGADGPLMPPVDESAATARVLTDLWEPSPDEVMELADWMIADLEALKMWKQRVKAAGDEQRRLENRLKAALGEATTGVVNGVPVFTWTPQDGTWVERFYRKPTRVFRIKQSKET